MQEEVELGILKFNLSPKKGLKYLSDFGYIKLTPIDVANFFHQYQDRLDKTAVGDFLGKEREYDQGFCINVLNEYVNLMDFKNLPFDGAIRLFLSGFRLPGEAQKIDRIMEKFAERYYIQNQESFASADMAFILAFSTIMLQTNLHNPAIKDDKRMTKEQFIKQNKGISQDGELSDALLIEIYDRIAAQPISITNPAEEKLLQRSRKDESASFAIFQISQEKRRKEAFNNERKEMVRISEELFKVSVKKERNFMRTNTDALSEEIYAKPMFEIVWPPLLGVLSQLLETSDDSSIIEQCLRAFRFSIRLACRLDFPLARNTLINTLAKFTSLDVVRSLEVKHIEAIKSFVEIVSIEADWLDDSWTQVLQTFSLLIRIQTFSTSSTTREIFDQESNHSIIHRLSVSKRSSSEFSPNTFALVGMNMEQLTKIFTGPSRVEVSRSIELSNALQINSHVNFSLVEKIFVNSSLLSEESIYHFVKSLCIVSMLEINGTNSINNRGSDTYFESMSPRIYCLQKLVEVADFNMGIRPRIVWSNIWNLLASHFSAVGIHQNRALAMYAVDSLKQLSLKFLLKQELSNFSFQRIFLKPFEVIMSSSKTLEIKDLVLRCIEAMILTCAVNIRSGWKSIFSIFEMSSRETFEVASIAFKLIERLISTHFDLLVNDFVELMNSLVAFVTSNHSSLSLEALKHLANCAIFLSKDSIFISNNSTNDGVVDSNTHQIDQDASTFRLWWPLLLGLSTAVADSRLDIRILAIHTLQNVLITHGHIFSSQAWGVIFRGVVFPIIDSAKTDSSPQPKSRWPTQDIKFAQNTQSWISSTAPLFFQLCIDLFKSFQIQIFPVVRVTDLLNLFEECINQEIETLSKLAFSSYRSMILLLLNSKPQTLSQGIDELTEIISTRLCTVITLNMCLNFGPEVGFLKPKNLTQSATCPCHPLFTTHNIGKGTLVKVLEECNELGLKSRLAINLSWGVLYTTCDQNLAEETEPQASSLSAVPYNWRHFANAAMTSMIATLDSIKLLAELFTEHSSVWTIQNFQLFFIHLESIYWHARAFNEDEVIRSKLRAKNFMVFDVDIALYPHLLEQEVRSLSLLLNTSFELLNSNRFEGTDFAHNWIERFGKHLTDHYLKLESGLNSQNKIDSLLRLKHESYTLAVRDFLKSLKILPKISFWKHKLWFIPVLSQFIVCEDDYIRQLVKETYEIFINNLLMEENFS